MALGDDRLGTMFLEVLCATGCLLYILGAWRLLLEALLKEVALFQLILISVL